MNGKMRNYVMTETNMLSLAARKMEKNFIAVFEKEYRRKPQNQFSYDFWMKRLNKEALELEIEILKLDYDAICDELADLSNIIDYLYEKTLEKMIKGIE